MLVSVVVPVYNEEKTVARILEMLSQVPLDLDVIVVDDASTDHTWEILQQIQQQEPFNAYRYIHHERNQGKGVGLRTGFRLAKGGLVTVQDADMEYDPQDILPLVQKWEELMDAGYKNIAIYGVRNLYKQKMMIRWGDRFLTLITNVLFCSHIQDMETCYKLITGAVAHALPMTGRRFEIESEITTCILKAGYAIFEVPISYYPREDKKLSLWKNGWLALAMLLRQRFNRPFHVDESLPLKYRIDTEQVHVE